MEEKATAKNKAVSVVASVALAATLGVPTAAFADDDTEKSATQQAIEQQAGEAGQDAASDESEDSAAAATDDAVDASFDRADFADGAEGESASVALLSNGENANDATAGQEAEKNVAQIGDVAYTSLNEAISAAKDGETVTLLSDTTMGKTGRVDGESITLDLNGCTVQVDNRAFNVVNGGRLTLDDAKGTGTLKVNKIGSTLSLGIVTGSKGSVVMKGGTLEVPEYGIYTTNDDTGAYVSLQGGTIKATYGICSIGNGTEHSARIEVSGGEIQAGVFGFGTNGSTGWGGVDFSMTGGTIKSLAEDAPALYLPAYYSTATISGGAITGGTGIEIRAGELTVSGDAQISGTGPLQSNPNGSGSTSSGAAIAVAQHTTKQPINVTVSGNAKLSGTAAVYESNPQKNDAEAIKQVSLALEGGTFESTAKGADGVSAVYSEDCTGFVSGGSYNTELPSSLVADGSALLVDADGAAVVKSEADVVKDAGAYVEKDGKKVYYTTSEAAQNANPDASGDVKTYCAVVDGVKYTSLADAISAAGESAEVALMADTAESITIPAGKNISLDLAGFTLTGGDNGKDGVNNTITNQGTLTIKDSSDAKTGTVMGGTDTGNGNAGRSGIALVNEGTCTIESGTVKRGDDGTFGNYTVYNKEAGTMTIKGGAVTNNSNTSSLIRNDGAMEISGGEITQMKFNAVKNDYGKLTISGGTISSGDQALQNWAQANITGGTLNGAVYTWAMQGAPDGYEFLTTITGGTINGNVAAVNYDGSDATAQIVVSGPAQINGDVVAYDRSSGSMQPAENGDGVLIEISDGTFTGSVDADFVVPGSGLEVDENGNLTAVEAKLVAAESVVNGVYSYDVSKGKEITEADLMALMGMNVDIEKSGYTISVDATNLPALNKAIGAKEVGATFDFVYSATKDGAVTYDADGAVDPVTVTVKLVDSTVTPGTGDDQGQNQGQEQGQNGSSSSDEQTGDKDKAEQSALAKTSDAVSPFALVAGSVAALAALAAAASLVLRRKVK